MEQKTPSPSSISFDLHNPHEMAKIAEAAMITKAKKSFSSAYLSSIFGGFFIALAFVFFTLVTTGSGAMPYGMAKLVGGICFSMGLMLVVICGSDLFTSTTMTVIAKASKKITWWELVKNWLTVYFGNFTGAMLLVAIIYASGHPWDANGSIALNYLNIAQHKIHHTFIEAVALGIMCNVMVCLGVWLAYSGRSTTDKLLAVILPVAMFVACGFEHCVANMYEIPMGIFLQSSATPEFWAAQGIDAAKYADLSWGNFLLNNLLPVTIGNIIGGGLLIGMGNWLLFLRPSVRR